MTIRKTALPNEIVGLNAQIDAFYCEFKKNNYLKLPEMPAIKRSPLTDFFMIKLAEFVYILRLLSDKIKDKDKDSIDMDGIQQVVDDSSNEILQIGNSLTMAIEDKNIVSWIKGKFRKIAGEWVYKSEIMKRGLEKPKGYPGDYVMLERIYNNKPISDGIGYFFDKYFLNDKLAQAVRNRKNYMAEVLKNCKNKKMDILNLACGSSRDIVEALPELEGNAPIRFFCIDQDLEAVDFSLQATSQTSKNVKINFIRENILNLFKSSGKHIVKGPLQLIYSIGLGDYLPDKILQRFFKYCAEKLDQNSEFIIAHKDYVQYDPISADWFCDWKFFRRKEEDLVKLVDNRQFSIKVVREPSQVIYFLVLSKK